MRLTPTRKPISETPIAHFRFGLRLGFGVLLAVRVGSFNEVISCLTHGSQNTPGHGLIFGSFPCTKNGNEVSSDTNPDTVRLSSFPACLLEA